MLSCVDTSFQCAPKRGEDNFPPPGVPKQHCFRSDWLLIVVENTWRYSTHNSPEVLTGAFLPKKIPYNDSDVQMI